MSRTFLSIFRAIEKGVGIAAGIGQQFAPVVSAFNPAAGSLMALICTSVIKAEAAYPAPQSGAAKKAAVMDNLMQALNLASAMAGKTLPADAEKQLSVAVDSIVVVLNSINNVTPPAPPA